MLDLDWVTLAFLLLISLVAGCIDAISGGGGLMTVLALFAICGTSIAEVGYARRVSFDWNVLAPAMFFASVRADHNFAT